MPDATFADHKQHMESYDPGLVLGQLCWYSIPEMHVDHSTVVQQMQTSGLDQLALPPVPRSADVFKRACTASQKRRVHTNFHNVFHNFRCVEVGKDGDRIWRKIVLERVDTDDRSLGYTELAELTFDRATATITHTYPCGHTHQCDDRSFAQPRIDEIYQYYKEWNNALTSYAIRELIRNLLNALHATVVRPSGGVYFVREDDAPLLFALENMINNLPGGCSLHTLPLLNDMKQRAMLKKAFEDESIEEIDRILGEMGEIIKSGNKITSARYADYADQYNTLSKKVGEYSALLDDAVSETASRLEIMQTTIVHLMDTVKL